MGETSKDPSCLNSIWAKEEDKAVRAGEVESACHSLAEMALGLDETQRRSYLLARSIDLVETELLRFCSSWLERVPFISFERT